MKKLQKNALKVLVIVALSCSMAFADDGDMGGGGLADSGIDGKTDKPVITITTEDGDMGGGGRLSGSSYFGFVIDSIYDYLV